MTIERFPLEAEETEITVPVGSKRLTVGVQKETPTLWFDTTSNKTLKKFRFRLVTDGSASSGEYVGTCVLYGGDSVVHVFLSS